MSTSERMLQLLSLLQTHRYWPGPELAGRLEVSERTLRRDVERLRDLGYDVDAARGSSGGYQLRAGRALPPLLLDNDEAVAIAVGLRSSATAVVDGGGEAAISALTKVVAMMPPALRGRMEALQSVDMPGPRASGARVDAQVLTTLAAAARDSEIVRFRYVARSGQENDRRVEPHALVSFAQRWYLVAYDLVRGDWRTFRLDRLDDVRTFGGRFTPRELPGGSALEYVRRGRAALPRRYAVRVHFAAPAEQVRAATGNWGEVDPDPRGCVWSINVDELDWPVMIVAELGLDFTVLQPPELTERIAEAAARMARCASAPSAHVAP